jgi:hypothetical protein
MSEFKGSVKLTEFTSTEFFSIWTQLLGWCLIDLAERMGQDR